MSKPSWQSMSVHNLHQSFPNISEHQATLDVSEDSTFTEPTWESQVPARRPRNPYLNHSSTTTGDWGHRMRCPYRFHDPQWYPIKEQGALDERGVSVLNQSGSTAAIDVLMGCRFVSVTAVVCLFVWCCLIFLRLNTENLEGKKANDILKIYIRNDAT